MTGTYGHSHGRRDVGYICSFVERMLARRVPPEMAEIYREAILRIDADLPHGADGMHGFPGAGALADIELVEEALALAGIEVTVSAIYRYIRGSFFGCL